MFEFHLTGDSPLSNTGFFGSHDDTIARFHAFDFPIMGLDGAVCAGSGHRVSVDFHLAGSLLSARTYFLTDD